MEPTKPDPAPDQATLATDPPHHPAAALFPLMDVDGAEFGELVRDLQEHGLLQPIVLHEGQVLDGRNRLRACRHAGVEPRYVAWTGESPTAYVLSLNLHRRHLTDGQKAMIAADALPLFEAEARERQREAGRETAARKQEPGQLEANLPQAARPAPKARDRAPQARDRAAAATGVSGRTVQAAKAVKEKAPDLAERVHAGAMSLHAAERQVKRREAEELQATLDLIDPEGAVRQQQAGLVAAWSTAQARLSRSITDVMAFDLDEVGPLLDEVNRYAVGVGIDHLHNYCSALERMLAATASLHVIDGSGRR